MTFQDPDAPLRYGFPTCRASAYRVFSFRHSLPKLIKRAYRLFVILLAIGGWPTIAATADPAKSPGGVPAVWFTPAEASPDFVELFVHPEAWPQARAKIGAFLFSPYNVETPKPGQPNSLADLTRVDAFRKLQAWGIETAIEAPGIKEWDCDGRKSVQITDHFIRNVVKAGGKVDILSLDEPLVSAQGHNKPICHASFEEAAQIMGHYQANLGSLSAVAAQRKIPALFEDEAYPSFSIGQLENWLRVAAAQGFRPTGFTLDIDLNAVAQSPESRARLVPDLREMQRFLKQARIAFGLILWSGHDPLRTDRAYYDDVMAWAQQVHQAIGRPDYMLFESWVTRCTVNGPCRPHQPACSAGDPPYCGRKSIPLNLPEANPDAYSHTRLINDALSIFEKNPGPPK